MAPADTGAMALEMAIYWVRKMQMPRFDLYRRLDFPQIFNPCVFITDRMSNSGMMIFLGERSDRGPNETRSGFFANIYSLGNQLLTLLLLNGMVSFVDKDHDPATVRERNLGHPAARCGGASCKTRRHDRRGNQS